MKLLRLKVRDYKNLRDCEIEFTQPFLLNAIIGRNGSGKSNLIEAILHILLGFYFKRLPPFDFAFEFEAQERHVKLECNHRTLSVRVDGEPKSVEYFAERLRDGSGQVYYPELTLVYYSGACQRVRRLLKRYEREFQRLTRKPETDRYRPLFVETSNEQANIILLALFAHRKLTFLNYLGLTDVANISLELRSPQNFDPKKHEPKLWNTEGAVRRIIAAIDETALSEQSRRQNKVQSEGSTEEEAAFSEIRTYQFRDGLHGEHSITDLADRLNRSGDNLYLALEHLRVRGIFKSVSFQLKGPTSNDLFEFDQLSEGEKQLVAVIGAFYLTNRPDNLLLLDEPDTHLNPQWTWEYSAMLSEAFNEQQRRRSTVLMATHNPVMISGLTRDQVLLAHPPSNGASTFTRPVRNPRGQGVANLLCSQEFFGLPSSLDKETQKLLDERLQISIRQDLTHEERMRLKELNEQLEITMSPGISERDPEYVKFLRERHGSNRG